MEIINDITGAEAVEVKIRADGKVLWVNTDKGCILRVCRINKIYLEDCRDSKEELEKRDTEDLKELLRKMDKTCGAVFKILEGRGILPKKEG